MSTRIRRSNHPRQRGMLMVMTLLFIVVFIAVAVALLTSATNTAYDALSVSQKNRVFDAAEAGLNNALAAVEASSGASTCGGGTAQGIAFTCTIDYNNISSSSAQANVKDPGSGQLVTVPAGAALAHGTASVNGSRTVVVEGIITGNSGFTLGGGAIRARNHFNDNSHAPIQTSPANLHNANVYVDGNIYASGNPSPVDGSTYAVGFDQLAGITTNPNSPFITFPTPAQVTDIANAALAAAKSGQVVIGSKVGGKQTYSSPNIYIDGNVNLSTPADQVKFTGGGYVYVNGNVTISGQASLFNANGSTIIVSGSFSTSGQGGGYNTSSSAEGTVVALGTSGINVVGNGSQQVIGLMWAPYGPVTMSGNGTIIGQLVSGNSTCAICDVTFNGGGSSGAFTYDPAMSMTFFQTGKPTITAYSEY